MFFCLSVEFWLDLCDFLSWVFNFPVTFLFLCGLVDGCAFVAQNFVLGLSSFFFFILYFLSLMNMVYWADVRSMIP